MKRDSPTVIWLIWDAASYWVVDELLSEGALPNLQTLLARGVLTPAVPPFPNCQTPPSLATLFSGSSPHEHGVCGFDSPSTRANDPVTCSEAGFRWGASKKKLIWELANDSGRSVVTAHVPWAIPPDAEQAPTALSLGIDAYRGRHFRSGTVTLSPALNSVGGEQTVFCGRHEMRLVRRPSCIRVSIDASHVDLPLPTQVEVPQFNHYLTVKEGAGSYLDLMIQPDSRELMLLHSGLWDIRTAPRSFLPRLYAEKGPFVGESQGSAYRNGRFGARLFEGGTGLAEQVFLASLELQASCFESSSVAALQQCPAADLYIFYQPCIDDVQHEIMRWCRPRHLRRSAQDNGAWELLRCVYRLADRQLGSVMHLERGNATILVSSDHGMVGVEYNIHVNEALREAGLLQFDSQGNIDLSKTQALFHPANNGSLVINDVSRPQGIVAHDQRAHALERVCDAIGRMRGAPQGNPPVEAIYPRDLPLGEKWSAIFGDMFLVAGRGYDLRAENSIGHRVVVPTRKGGIHVMRTKDNESLSGIFAASKAVLAPGHTGPIDNRDVMQLVCQELGMECGDARGSGQVSPWRHLERTARER